MEVCSLSVFCYVEEHDFSIDLRLKKVQNNILKPNFGPLKKIQLLDLKVCVDPSWLLVLKNGI